MKVYKPHHFYIITMIIMKFGRMIANGVHKWNDSRVHR